MKRRIAPRMFLAAFLAFVFSVVLTPLQAEASHCSTAAAAGKWAYTYTGTIFTQNGPLPAASVGHFSEDAAGNITGSQGTQRGRKPWGGGHLGHGQREQRLHRYCDRRCACEWTGAAYGCPWLWSMT